MYWLINVMHSCANPCGLEAWIMGKYNQPLQWQQAYFYGDHAVCLLEVMIWDPVRLSTEISSQAVSILPAGGRFRTSVQFDGNQLLEDTKPGLRIGLLCSQICCSEMCCYQRWLFDFHGSKPNFTFWPLTFNIGNAFSLSHDSLET